MLTFAFCLSFIPLNAQQNKDSSPAKFFIDRVEKTLYKTLPNRFSTDKWMTTEKGYAESNIESVQKSIASIKKKDTNWDVSTYEKDLAVYEQQMADLAAGKISPSTETKSTAGTSGGNSGNKTSSSGNSGNSSNSGSEGTAANNKSGGNSNTKTQPNPEGTSKPKKYSGPASFSVDDFNKTIATIQRILDKGTAFSGHILAAGDGVENNLMYARDYLAEIKRKDPNLDLTPYQETYDKYQKIYDEGMVKAKADHKAAEDAKEYALEKPVKDDGITSDFHKQNLKKLVFSTQKIDLNNPDPSMAKTTFGLNQPIFMRIYGEKSIGNYYREREVSGKYKNNDWRNFLTGGSTGTHSHSATFTWRYFVDGKEVLMYQDDLSSTRVGLERIDEWTCWWTELIPVEKERYYTVGAPVKFFGEEIAFMSPGSHKFKIELWVSDFKSNSNEDLEIFAEGEFTLSFTASDQKKYRVERGSDFPKAVSSNASMEAHFKKAYNAEGNTALGVSLQNSAWQIERHSISGIPLRRTWKGVVGYKQSNGECYIQDAYLKQEHNGSNYGTVEVFSNMLGRHRRIGCDEIK